MGNSANSADIIKGALSDVGELPNGVSDLHQFALERLNDSYLAILSGASEFNPDFGDTWSWARNTTPRSITLQPSYETGTISLVNASAAGTFSVAPSVSLGSFVNRWVRVTDRDSWYLITAHTAGATAFTLDQAYLEATGATLSYQAIPLIYNLGAGVLRLVEPFRCYADWSSDPHVPDEERGKIYGIDLNQLRKDYPLHLLRPGVPIRFASQRRSDNAWYVEVNSYPVSTIKVDYDFIPMPEGLIDSDQSIPVLPREFRRVLRYTTAHYLAIKKNYADLATYFYNLAGVTLKSMAKAENKNTTFTGKNKGLLQPRQEQIRRPRPNGYE